MSLVPYSSNSQSSSPLNDVPIFDTSKLNLPASNSSENRSNESQPLPTPQTHSIEEEEIAYVENLLLKGQLESHLKMAEGLVKDSEVLKEQQVMENVGVPGPIDQIVEGLDKIQKSMTKLLQRSVKRNSSNGKAGLSFEKELKLSQLIDETKAKIKETVKQYKDHQLAQASQLAAQLPPIEMWVPSGKPFNEPQEQAHIDGAAKVKGEATKAVKAQSFEDESIGNFDGAAWGIPLNSLPLETAAPEAPSPFLLHLCKSSNLNELKIKLDEFENANLIDRHHIQLFLDKVDYEMGTVVVELVGKLAAGLITGSIFISEQARHLKETIIASYSLLGI